MTQGAQPTETMELDSNLGTLIIRSPTASTIELKGVPMSKLEELAAMDDEHFAWVQQFFEKEAHCLNIKPLCNKVCLSREPCELANFRCGHLHVKKLQRFLKLVESGLIRVQKVFIECHAKPASPRLSMHVLAKLLEPLSGLCEVYVDVNNEMPYVNVIGKLLERSAETLQTFYARRKNEAESALNFSRFLSVSKFGFENFPLKAHYLTTHRLKQKKKRERAGSQQSDDDIGDDWVLIDAA